MTDYTLHIDAYSPETIPMARLAEYMQRLADLLGHKDAVHFEGLAEGSTQLQARIENEAIPKVARDLRELKTGSGSPSQQKARQQLDDMMADDNASGRLCSEHDGDRGIIIEFPGATAPQPQVYGPIKKSDSLQGLLARIGGADATVHLLLQNGDVGYRNIVCDRGTARELAKHLFDPIRIHGEGRWIRDRNGDWVLKSFRVKNFDVLQRGTIGDAFDELHRKRQEAWPTFQDDEDIADVINLRREDN